jgi:hypothetical protein
MTVALLLATTTTILTTAAARVGWHSMKATFLRPRPRPSPTATTTTATMPTAMAVAPAAVMLLPPTQLALGGDATALLLQMPMTPQSQKGALVVARVASKSRMGTWRRSSIQQQERWLAFAPK